MSGGVPRHSPPAVESSPLRYDCWDFPLYCRSMQREAGIKQPSIALSTWPLWGQVVADGTSAGTHGNHHGNIRAYLAGHKDDSYLTGRKGIDQKSIGYCLVLYMIIYAWIWGDLLVYAWICIQNIMI